MTFGHWYTNSETILVLQVCGMSACQSPLGAKNCVAPLPPLWGLVRQALDDTLPDRHIRTHEQIITALISLVVYVAQTYGNSFLLDVLDYTSGFVFLLDYVIQVGPQIMHPCAE